MHVRMLFERAPLANALSSSVPSSPMFRAGSRAAQLGFKRLNSSAPHHAPAPTENEIDVSKVLGLAALAGISLYFYRSTKEPVIKTPLYNQQDERSSLRNEAYLKRYKTSFVKTFIRDKGGIGERVYRRQVQGAVPNVLIPAASPYGDRFGASIKTDKLGPRKERTKYFTALENSN